MTIRSFPRRNSIGLRLPWDPIMVNFRCLIWMNSLVMHEICHSQKNPKYKGSEVCWKLDLKKNMNVSVFSPCSSWNMVSQTGIDLWNICGGYSTSWYPTCHRLDTYIIGCKHPMFQPDLKTGEIFKCSSAEKKTCSLTLQNLSNYPFMLLMEKNPKQPPDMYESLEIMGYLSPFKLPQRPWAPFL